MRNIVALLAILLLGVLMATISRYMSSNRIVTFFVLMPVMFMGIFCIRTIILKKPWSNKWL